MWRVLNVSTLILCVPRVPLVFFILCHLNTLLLHMIEKIVTDPHRVGSPGEKLDGGPHTLCWWAVCGWGNHTSSASEQPVGDHTPSGEQPVDGGRGSHICGEQPVLGLLLRHCFIVCPQGLWAPGIRLHPPQRSLREICADKALSFCLLPFYSLGSYFTAVLTQSG